MRKRLTGSAILALTVLATVAVGQPPPAPPSAPKADDRKVEKKPADSTDAAIAAALANDPDVKIARAKLQLAEAELAKARLAVAQKVIALRATIELHKKAVEVAEVKFRNTEHLNKGSAPVVSATEVQIERLALQRAQSALAAAEAELKLLTGPADGTGPLSELSHQLDVDAALAIRKQERLLHNQIQQLYIRTLPERSAIKGPIPDRIRAALDQPVKLGPKGQEVTFPQALEVFRKEAGLDISVRGTLPAQTVIDPKNPNGVRQRAAAVDSEGETLPVGAWLQLFEDNAIVPLTTGTVKYHFYVREYGLLISSRESAPTDAPTLTEFWKQASAKEPKKEPTPNK